MAMQLVKSNLQRVTLNEATPASVFENQILVFAKPHIQDITPSILLRGWSRYFYISVLTNVLLFGVLFYIFLFRSLSTELSQNETMTTPKEILPISENLRSGKEIVDDALRILVTEPTVDPDAVVRMKQFPNSEDGIVGKSVPDKFDVEVKTEAKASVTETIKQLENLEKTPAKKAPTKQKKFKKFQKTIIQ